MRCAIIAFPGSNRDRDMVAAVRKISSHDPQLVWHAEAKLPPCDVIIIPGGFSYGDYLRAGAIAARSPIMDEVRMAADKGVRVLGVCNGFQVLTEAGLLPGGLMRNASLKFVCKDVDLSVSNANTAFSKNYAQDQILRCPVAHHDGNYFADKETIRAIEENGQVVFRYANDTNPNGSINDIAGIINSQGNVLGMMPHPENLIENAHGGLDGRGLFESMFDIQFA